MLFLVFANGYFYASVQQDVGRHQHRVGKQSCVDVVGLSTCFVFERGYTLQFAQVGVHVQEQVQFRSFRNIALKVNGAFFRIEAQGDILCQYAFH